MKQRLAILGSTGSIGRQTLDTMRAFPDRFEVVSLTADSNWEALAAQALEFAPDSVVIARKELYPKLKEALAHTDVKVYAGHESICSVAASSGVDTVVNALVGYAGFAPSLRALEAGHKLALANKESLVVGGETVMRAASEHRAPVIPIDSEHSAVFQSLAGETSPIRRIILTASGGPFLDMTSEEMERVIPGQALRHPRWTMGPRITVDSATMLNKGFEVIEARWLFGVDAGRIDVVIHPEAVIHSMVEFEDGAIKAQMGRPDMHIPIQYALTFPHRLPVAGAPFDFAACASLTFRAPDRERFPMLELAYRALESGGNAACILNAAGEVAVEAFLTRRIGFLEMARIVERTMDAATFVAQPTLDDYAASDAEARRLAAEMI
ncbi:1-deoxy-D-xylulose 5-phosphate reductoisomerase [Bacteroidia bacterium]|nr:1-deoxy-D-xylulose 5-phosphate reductoisomerase [Bacteroidia bacterium]